MEAIIYLMQVSACTGIFYMFYYALLRRLTFFTINRWYLLGTLLLSFVIPAIKIQVDSQPRYVATVQQVALVGAAQVVPQMPADLAPVKINPVAQSLNWVNVIKWVYIISVILLLVYLLITLAILFIRLKGRPVAKIGNVKILSGYSKPGNGSFFNYIFLTDLNIRCEELKHVVAHEMLHVKLYHSADRVIVRLAQIVLWFNPFVYLYARAIEANHEFEVDGKMAKSLDKRMYANLLLQLSVTGQGSLYNGFSKVQLIRRIQMLFNKPSKNMKKLTYLLVVPMVTVSCLVFATSLKVKIKNRFQTTQIDTSQEKYRQKITNRRAADSAMFRQKAYMRTNDFIKKSKLVNQIMDNEVVVKVKEIYGDGLTGINRGFLMTYNDNEFKIRTGYGQEKQLENILKPGDVITIRAFNSAILPHEPVWISPAYVKKNNIKIFQLAEADKIPNYPFLYEVNKVRFADGQVTHIEKYDNGKWKKAILETINGYKFNMNFKSNSPDLTDIKWGDHVRFRFVHEVKTGQKEYSVNDWVSLAGDVKGYGVINPDFFYRFYEKI